MFDPLSILLTRLLLTPGAAEIDPGTDRESGSAHGAPSAPAAPQADAPVGSAPPAPAQPRWEQILVPHAVRRHLHGDGLRVLVVPAGGHPEAERTAMALQEAFEAGGRVDEAKRAAATMLRNDSDIVRRVTPQGFDRVAVVRVFDVDDRLQAVINVLDARGRSIDAFLAWDDRPLDVVADAGAVEAVVDATIQAEDADPEIRARAAARARAEARGDDDEARAPSSSPQPPKELVGYAPSRRAFYLSESGTALRGAALYDAIDRSDFGRKHARRSTLGWVLMTAGGSTMFFGSVWMGLAGTERARVQIGGSLSIVAGGAALGAGLALALCPVSLSTRRELIDEYNREVRRSRHSRRAFLRSARVALSPRGLVFEGRF